ncbi:MAG TPA: serine hydrolase domain-containing protein, partial [Pseudonocardiaceae bacterium]
MAEIDGFVAAGFERVRDVFAASFEQDNEVGAGVCVYLDGRPVVDLWGGVADKESGREWTGDTLQLVYSVTKAMTAACAHLLVQRGELDLDAPVSTYWPEFAAEGKERVPVRWLLSHRVGLPALDKPVPVADALAWDPVVDALARQRPFWEPGTRHGYHAQTFGFLVGEVVRRVSGRSVGRLFAEEIARPNGIEFWIGLPAELEAKVSRLIELPPETRSPEVEMGELTPELREMIAAFSDPDSLTMRAFGLTKPSYDANAREVHAAELPASNGIGTARGIARFYAGLIGEVDGKRILAEDTVRTALVEQSNGMDEILKRPTRLGAGFMLPVDGGMTLGGPTSFGHPGKGGALGFADPERGIAFGYAPNRLHSG